MDNTNILCDIKNVLNKINNKLGIALIGAAIYIWSKSSAKPKEK